MKEFFFKKAVPVWEQGKECEKNYHLVFECNIPSQKNTYLALSCANNYQLFINNQFVAQGPARAGHGYFRVDQILLDKYLTSQNNLIKIYVASYYVPNFYLPKQEGFFCAEITVHEEILCATGEDNFLAYHYNERLQKVNRYSYQRTFTEVYDFTIPYKKIPVVLIATPKKIFIERQVPYPTYEEFLPQKSIVHGEIDYSTPTTPLRDRYINFDDPQMGFFLDELELISCDEITNGTYIPLNKENLSPKNLSIPNNHYSIFSLSCEKTGFLQLEIECTGNTQFMAVFDEILINDDVSFSNRMRAINTIIWKLNKGHFILTSYEPYSMKYIKLINKSSDTQIKIRKIKLIEFAFNYKNPGLKSKNSKLNAIYDAAIESFKQNTLDIYMDCPSRERAGWLCDSYFTAKTEYFLTQKSCVEKNFLENFIYKNNFHDIPNLMLPMCYPADFNSHLFIPQWAMWYVIELEDYFKRSHDIILIQQAEHIVRNLLAYFKNYENSDGLLENLDGWNMLEWSRANDFTSGVNYPTNMLYGQMLNSAGFLYEKEFCIKASHIFSKIREQSFHNGFFHDHSIRTANDTLALVTDDISETCQYYAFFTGTASFESHPELWNQLVEYFGPNHTNAGVYKHIAPSNAFIGYFLRLELLSKANLHEKVLNDIEQYFYYMADTTGTLWENKTSHASCNHGFASYVAVLLYQALHS